LEMGLLEEVYQVLVYSLLLVSLQNLIY